jgi:hypothetical protein
MTIFEICKWLESTALAVLVRESSYGFPILVGIHILGLILSVGTLLWVDLRLLGVSLASGRVSEGYRGLAPWFGGGFLVMFLSGATLFAGFATAAYANLYFRIKVVALVLAGLNALAFHVLTQRGSTAWDTAPRPPAAVRLAGLISIVLWTVVILAGRLISYTMF